MTRKRLKVLVVSPYYPPASEWGGPIFCIPMLARAVRDAGAEVDVFTTNGRGEHDLPKVTPGMHEVDTMQVRYFDAKGPLRFFFSPGMTLELLLRVRRYDVVHINGVFMYPTAAASRICRLMRVPYVVTVHGMLAPWALAHRGPKKWVYLGLLELGSLLGAARIHYTSEEELRVTPSFVRSVPPAVVPHGVDVAAFDNDTQRPHRPGEPVRLIIAGRIHKVKGFDLLIPALGQVKRSGRQFHLTIAGFDEGNYSDVVKRLAQEHGVADDITFTGNLERPRLAEEFARAEVALMPSYQENFGMSGAEAMVTGLPVVVSDTVCIAPDIASYGAGIVVPLEVEHIAGAINRLVDSEELRRRMGEAGRALVHGEYLPEVVGRKMISVYEEILRQAQHSF